MARPGTCAASIPPLTRTILAQGRPSETSGPAPRGPRSVSDDEDDGCLRERLNWFRWPSLRHENSLLSEGRADRTEAQPPPPRKPTTTSAARIASSFRVWDMAGRQAPCNLAQSPVDAVLPSDVERFDRKKACGGHRPR